VAECGRAKKELFVGGRDPWCRPDVVALEVVREVVARCPSGALVVEPKDGAEETAEPENTITVSPHGPYYVRGELAIAGAPGDMPGVRFRAALCRCGASSNKPFCDGAHDKSGFRDHGAVGEPGHGGEAALARRSRADGERGPIESHSKGRGGAEPARGERSGAEDGGVLSIECAKNGPLLVRGNFSIRAASGRVAYRGTKASLCRCGHSNNRPFCDGSHKAAGFEAD
jgi:CDGSH-type Zn-finger protein